MAKSLQSWSVKEAGAPIINATIHTNSSTTKITFDQTTRALMGVTVSSGSGNLDVNLVSGVTVTIPNSAINALFSQEQSFLSQLILFNLVAVKVLLLS